MDPPIPISPEPEAPLISTVPSVLEPVDIKPIVEIPLLADQLVTPVPEQVAPPKPEPVDTTPIEVPLLTDQLVAPVPEQVAPPKPEPVDIKPNVEVPLPTDQVLPPA